MTVSIVKRAFKGEQHCGDECAVWKTGGKTILCVADGLGHGEDAELAAKAAITFVSRHLSEPLKVLFDGCNREIRDTRGVAMGIAVVDEGTREMIYAGIGNIRALVVRNNNAGIDEGTVVRLASNPGIVGGGYKTLTPETIGINPGDLVIIFTDGIEEHIDLSGHNKIPLHETQKLAETIIRDWGRDSDDAAILIFRSEEN